MTSHRYQPGDRVSWPAPVFTGEEGSPFPHPTEREYGTIAELAWPYPMESGPSYIVHPDFDPTGFMSIHESALQALA